MKNSKILLTVLLIVVSGLITAYGQKADKKPKIKSLIVLEEKSDMLVKKQVKESETRYDAHGNITEDITYKQGKESKHFRYKYDNDDNKILEEKLDQSGNVTEYSEYKYENGLRIEKIVYTGAGKIKSRKVYQYTTW
jgi:hypothetical protein